MLFISYLFGAIAMRICLALVVLGLLSVPAIAYEPEVNGGPSKTVGTGTRFVERGSGRLDFHRGSGR